MRRLGGILSGVLTFVLVLVFLAGGTGFYLKSQFQGDGPLSRETAFMVAPGEGLVDIAGNLQSQGVIRDSRLFVAGAFVKQARDQLKAGEYILPAHVSMDEILETLVAGRSVQHKLTVPEGFTSEQVVQRLLAHPVLVGDVTEVPPEGALLPDTYVFLRGMTRQKLLDRMRNAQKKAIEELWPKRAPGLPIQTPEEAIILASIIEKETGKSEERARVASVFVNRLKRRMRLQSDPTIIYGIVGGKGVLDRPISKADIVGKTPYNTYQIDGLPPTPIANPGVAAIEAVLNPATSDELYFVADGTGGHAFAETLAGHRKNVALWRQIEAERRRLKAAEEAAGEVSPDGSPQPSTTADGGDGDAVSPASTASQPPPPPPPAPSAEPAARKRASPVPAPEPKSAEDVEEVGSVTVAATDGDAEAVQELQAAKPSGDGRDGARSRGPVPRPRPKPDPIVAGGPEESTDADEPGATPGAPIVIRPATPMPAQRRDLRQEGFR